MTTAPPDLDALAEIVIASPEDAEALRRFAGAVRRHGSQVTATHSGAIEVLLGAPDVKHERLGPVLERLVADRYADAPINARAAAADPLFVGLLGQSFVTRTVIEDMCIGLRRTVVDDDNDVLIAALALQAFNNEYLLGGDTEEIEAARQAHRRGLSAADAVAATRDLLRSAMYLPLDEAAVAKLTGVDRAALPDAFQRALVRLVDEPLEEARIAPTIPAFGRIADATSVRVQAQYEEHPFPRWLTAGSGQGSLDRRFTNGVPSPSQRFPGEGLRVLVPGCGTGQHPLTLAMGDPTAAVLGVDLSRASLAYARRKADEAGAQNLELLHGDLLDLPSLGRTFHHIDCVGVLHHLGDPTAGWRALVEVLEPGGTLHVGVYGKAARLPVTFVRNDVARLGLHPTEADMRAYRRRLLTEDRYAPILKAVRGGINTMSHLRDTLFHASEHQYSLNEIEATLDELGLRLLWVDLRGPLKERYREAHGDTPLSDFDRWREFEPAYAGSLRMFDFWVEKPA